MHGDGAGHQGVAGVEQHHLVLLELEGGLEGGEGVDHLVLGVQHEAVSQALRTWVACSNTRHLASVPALGRGEGPARTQKAASHSPGRARLASRQAAQRPGDGTATVLM